MKQYQIFASLFILLIYNGCAPTNFLSKESSEQVFEHQLSLSKQDIKIKLLTFISENTISAKSVIQVNEDGFLSCNSYIDIGSFSPGLLLLPIAVSMEFSYIIKYQDNNYKLKLIVKDLFYNSLHAVPGIWGKHEAEINQSFHNFDSTLYNYLDRVKNF